VTCRQFVEFLMDYLAGDLPAEQRAAFDEHLEQCSDCVAYLHTYETTIRLGKCICPCPDAPVPAEVPEDLIQAILAALRR
jgi:anti-sigma factor RsiW